MLDLERAWGDALVRRDAALMDRIVAYEMIGTDPGGNRWNKAAYLESVKSGSFSIESLDLADVTVRVFGDAAVATGRSIVNQHSKSGFARGGALYTDTYIRRNGCWQCVAWQSVGVPDQTPTHAPPAQEQSKPAELKAIKEPSDPTKLPQDPEPLTHPRAESRDTPVPSELPESPSLPAVPKQAPR